MFEGYINVNFEEGKRIIAISDIYGDLDSFKEVLAKCNYKKGEDYLVILGNVIEKGSKIIETLHYLMELSKDEKVFILKGNCDRVLNFCSNEKPFEECLNYVSRHEKSIINQRANELDIDIISEEDLRVVVNSLREEKEFLESLPLVLVSDRLVFVHAAITTLEQPESEKVLLNTRNFGMMSHNLDKYVVVGHTPTCTYHQEKINNNPYYDIHNRIISINGGNMLKVHGQLNALIIENLKSGLTFTHRFATSLPKVLIRKTQEGSSESPKKIVYPHLEVKMLNAGEEYSLVLNHNHEYVRVKNRYLSSMGDKWRVKEDYSDYLHPIQNAAIAYIIDEDENSYYANVDGIIGWINK